MNRRAVALLALALLVASLAAEAQRAGRVYQVGIVSLGPASPRPTRDWQPFIEELHELNYVQGRNLILTYANADAKPERLPSLVADLVNAKVDVIVTTGPRETLAARRTTSSLPIIFTLIADPVGQGVVTNLARPHGNVTGVTTVVPGLYRKYVELLREIVPSAARFAVVVSPPTRPRRDGRTSRPPDVCLA